MNMKTSHLNASTRERRDRSRVGKTRGFRIAVRVALVVLAALTIVGCRSRASQTKTSASPAPPSASNADSKAVESKSVTIRDEEFDFPFSEETQKTFQLAPGSVVRVVSIRGKIDVEPSAGDSAEVYVVRSVERRDDLRSRQLHIEHESDELEIRMGRQRRSALFEMFGGHKSEKQRVLLKLPAKVELQIEGVNGRVKVGDIDGKVSVEAVHGNVTLGQVTGGINIAGVNGEVRVLANSRYKEGLEVADVNGRLDVLFNGDANTDLRVESVRGHVDPDLPNLVYDGERRGNNFRARAGKGGFPVVIGGVRGRVRIATARKEDLAPGAPTATATATATAKAPPRVPAHPPK